MGQLLNQIKYIVKADETKRDEKLVSTIVILGLGFLTKRAKQRGDFHEANHNVVALFAGDSAHESNEHCTIPSDRLLTFQESHDLASALKCSQPNEAVSEGVREVATGFYL